MSKLNITIPDLGDVNDVEVIEILVKPGDEIAADDPVIVLESAKASMDIPCPEAGTVESIAVNVGDKVNSGDAMLVLQGQASSEEQEPEPAPEPAEEAPEEDPAEAAASDADSQPPEADSEADAEAEPDTEPKTEPKVEAEADTEVAAEAKPASRDDNAPIHASPAVRRIATEHEVDLAEVSGSGPHGRITKADVQQHIDGSAGNAASSSAGSSTASSASKSTAETMPLSRIQKLSAQHLHQSWTNIPHVTHFDDADITELEQWRQQLKQQQPEQALSLLPFVMKAVSHCLAAEPRFNSQLNADGTALKLNSEINLGIAVDTKDGLVVPVIRQVDQLGIRALATKLSETAERARQGKLNAADFSGGSFTISNLGGIGGQHFTPIINAPEVGILGLGQARCQLQRMGLAQQQGDIVDRLIQPLALSYDHRVIDGAVAARFIARLKQALEDLRKILL